MLIRNNHLDILLHKRKGENHEQTLYKTVSMPLLVASTWMK